MVETISSSNNSNNSELNIVDKYLEKIHSYIYNINYDNTIIQIIIIVGIIYIISKIISIFNINFTYSF